VHHDIADYILDIVENAVDAGSTVITVDFLEDAEMIRICIGDNGPGMDEDTLKNIRSPFYTDGIKHAKRTVGLGLPFVEQAALASDGEFDIVSEKGTGTSVYFTFSKKHIDCPPVGDLAGTVVSLLLFDREYELRFNRSSEKGQYSFSKSELSDALGTLESADSINLARRYVSENEKEIA
jgi:anti-sigma regulatory factor (Ser/Thr protein kinase)